MLLINQSLVLALVLRPSFLLYNQHRVCVQITPPVGGAGFSLRVPSRPGCSGGLLGGNGHDGLGLGSLHKLVPHFKFGLTTYHNFVQVINIAPTLNDLHIVRMLAPIFQVWIIVEILLDSVTKS
jgi:hypothetical protein